MPFPNLAGGTSDLFAPGDRLLDLLSTAAAAQVRCGAAPDNPPTGVAAPGDTVYCDAVTPEGLTRHQRRHLERPRRGTVDPTPADAGEGGRRAPRATSSGSTAPTGSPTSRCPFTADGQQFVARSMPHTVQDVVGRIGELGQSSADARTIGGGRLDVAVDIAQATSSTGPRDRQPGHPRRSGRAHRPEGPGRRARHHHGDGLRRLVRRRLRHPDRRHGRRRRPADLAAPGGRLAAEDPGPRPPPRPRASPASVPGSASWASTPTSSELTLGRPATDRPAVELTRKGGSTAPLPVSGLLTSARRARPRPRSASTSNLDGDPSGSRPPRRPLPGGGYAAGGTAGQASGTATVTWGPAGLPQVTADAGYQSCGSSTRSRPGSCPARRGTGRRRRSTGRRRPAERHHASTTCSTSRTPAAGERTEVARRLLADGAACQNVTDRRHHHAHLPGLSLPTRAGPCSRRPGRGDDRARRPLRPARLRDRGALARRSTSSTSSPATTSRATGSPDDQYTSTLPLAALTPAPARRRAGGPPCRPRHDGPRRRRGRALRGGHAAARCPAPRSCARRSAHWSRHRRRHAAESPTPLTPRHRSPHRVRPRRPAPAGPSALQVGDLGQVQSQATLPVGVASTTTLAVDVVRATAQTAVADATRTTSTATVPAQAAGLAGLPDRRRRGDHRHRQRQQPRRPRRAGRHRLRPGGATARWSRPARARAARRRPPS